MTGPLATPAVSIVIPHYGEASTTLPLVQALVPQLEAARAELIVSDDCSPEPFACDSPEVRVVRRSVNGGFGSAVNSGAAAARGELLMILNSDLCVTPDFVSSYVAAARPWLPAVVAPRITDDDGVAETLRYFPTVRHITAEWLTPLARTSGTRAWREAVGHDTRASESTTACAVDWAVGAALLLRHHDFWSVGGFDETFFMNSEEVDLALRLSRRGVPVIYTPEVTVHHVGGGSSDPEKRRGWVVASRLRYADKWGGRRALQAALTTATAANFAWNVTRRLRRVPVAPITTARRELGYIWGADA